MKRKLGTKPWMEFLGNRFERMGVERLSTGRIDFKLQNNIRALPSSMRKYQVGNSPTGICFIFVLIPELTGNIKCDNE